MEEICDQITVIDNGEIVFQTDETDMNDDLSTSLEEMLLSADSMNAGSYEFDNSTLDWLV